jgi:hypothetical protein
MLPKRAMLRNPLQINMSLPIRDIYLKEVRILFCVRMLTLNLQNLSKSISANKVRLPAIIVVSLGTSGHTVLRSIPKSLGSGNKSRNQVSLALNVPSLIMFLRKSDNTVKGVLPYVITVARMVTPRSNASD